MLRAQSETSNAQQTQHGCSRIRWCAGLWLKNSNLVWHSFQCLRLPVFPNMPSSSVLLAKRSLVSLLLRLAVAYQVVISVNRTSPDAGPHKVRTRSAQGLRRVSQALEAGGRAVEIPQPRYDSFWTKSHSIVFVRDVFSHSAPTRNTRHPPSHIES